MFYKLFLILVDFVNFVNYKVYMNDKNNKKTGKISLKSLKKRIRDSIIQSGIYLRDDHCDWGSSGMNDLLTSIDEDK